MAYNRYEQRRGGREGEPSGRQDEERWRGHRDDDRQGRDERGFFERAGDEIASWFGDEDHERRRQRDDVERYGGEQYRGRWSGSRADADYPDDERDYGRGGGYGRSEQDRGRSGRRPRYAEGYSGSGMGPGTGMDYSGIEYRGPRDVQSWERSYRPFAGDLGRADSYETRGGSTYGVDRTDRHLDRPDPHYEEWRRRQIESLDRDYHDYRREHQAKFEDEFGGWRQRRQQQRQTLGQVRGSMEVVGSDNETVGTVDKVAGDRIVLTRGDDPSGAHHSLTCAMVERIEGNRVILNTTADQARKQWRDDERERALFERDDQGSAGPGALNRSFKGTY